MTGLTLADLGWSGHFARQQADWIATSDTPAAQPARISEIHRDRVTALDPDGAHSLTTADPTGTYAVGDWVLQVGGHAVTRLTPNTELSRLAAGHEAKRQLIAANVDTLGIVTSCNADFNPARLERYVAMAIAGGCAPLIVLTKADTCDDAQDYVRRARLVSPLVTAIALNAKDPDDAARLAQWCGPGQTLALVGSSGVGKTTLHNALTGGAAATRGVREDDARGRHTTTFRHLLRANTGGWLIDTPGMRELQLTDAADGIEALFDDVEELAAQCKFRDCAHETEPGCAVQAGLADGTLSADRLERWRKLSVEDTRNSKTLAATRGQQRMLARTIRDAQAARNKKR